MLKVHKVVDLVVTTPLLGIRVDEVVNIQVRSSSCLVIIEVKVLQNGMLGADEQLVNCTKIPIEALADVLVIVIGKLRDIDTGTVAIINPINFSLIDG